MDSNQASSLEEASFEALARNILDDCFHNIIHDIVMDVHREEKTLRMQSAIVIAEESARAQMPEPPSTLAKGAPLPTPKDLKFETPGATYENGKSYLRGNPLQTTPEVMCPHCRLPRLQYPITGKGSRDPDLSKEYCMFYPFVSKPGHDIYGNAFPTDSAKTKKERELIKQQARTEKDNTPGSNDTGTPPEKQSFSLNTGSKPISYIPWHTCPSCKRSLLITRFAQHLEKCLGISGRQSSRNAMAKLTGQNGSGNGNTPLHSRVGTPQPGSQSQNNNGKKSPTKKGPDDEDDDEKETPVKKKKKSSYIKKADRERMAAAGSGTSTPNSTQPSQSLKLKISSSANRPPKSDGGDKDAATTKREREEGGDGDVPRKKMKIAREDSIRTADSGDEGSDDELAA